MNKEYYVIVNLDTLEYQNNGEDTQSINYADKFDTLEEARKNLATYDKDFNGDIYKVTEYITIDLKKC